MREFVSLWHLLETNNIVRSVRDNERKLNYRSLFIYNGKQSGIITSDEELKYESLGYIDKQIIPLTELKYFLYGENPGGSDTLQFKTFNEYTSEEQIIIGKRANLISMIVGISAIIISAISIIVSI